MFDFGTGGAWRAALNPNPRRYAANNPNPSAAYNPNPSGAHNPNPSASNNPNPWWLQGLNPNLQHPLALNPNLQAHGARLLPPGVQWEQFDPDWVYGDVDGLLAQGLRRSEQQLDALVRSPVLQPKIKFDDEQRLLRWGSEFRIQALLAELCGCFCLAGGVLHHIDASARRFDAVFSIQGIDTLQWEEQIDKVLRAAIEREERMPEILSQRDSFWPYYDAITGLPLERLPRTAELMDLVYRWATMQLMGLKHHHAVLRPERRSSLVLPAIETPGHGSLPSGHATIASLMAGLLMELLYDNQVKHRRVQQLDAQARRISFNRVVAGVHFPIDSHCGRQFAGALLQWLRTLGKPLDRAAGERSRGIPEPVNWCASGQHGLLEKPDPSDLMPVQADSVKFSLEPLTLLSLQWRLVLKELEPHRA